MAKSGLGTINHTLLSLEALRSRNIPVLGVVFSDCEGETAEDALIADNMRVVAETGRCRVFGRIRRHGSVAEAIEDFAPIGAAILEAGAD